MRAATMRRALPLLLIALHRASGSSGDSGSDADGDPRKSKLGSAKRDHRRCGEQRYSAMIALAEGLSAYLVSNSSNRYLAHGQFGIFAGGAQIHARKRLPNYEGVKTRFLFSEVCSLEHAHGHGPTASSAQPMTICEVGFNAGLSALLLLEAASTSRVISFDLGDMPWTRNAESFLRSRYPDRFLGVVYGDSSKTIPRYKAAHAAFTCDAAFIDGDKSYHGRRSQLRRMRGVSYAGGRLFFDEVTAERCLDGSVPLGNHTAACHGLNGGDWPAVQAYDKSVRDGEVRVLGCAYPERYKDRDGICTAEFAK
mmetsp:Transcript_12860/g.32053  ORF Transcript_12860/g.32053 Transcript_12860/m.32053 type:complete len:310 (+) Transcript_12860:100-1029(+)